MSMVFKAYYSKNPAESLLGLQKISVPEINETHVLVCSVHAEHEDDAFRKMQGEVWSPNGEMRPLIEALGLKHTSMSVGDVLYDEESDRWLKCMPVGWEEMR